MLYVTSTLTPFNNATPIVNACLISSTVISLMLLPYTSFACKCSSIALPAFIFVLSLLINATDLTETFPGCMGITYVYASISLKYCEYKYTLPICNDCIYKTISYAVILYVTLYDSGEFISVCVSDITC